MSHNWQEVVERVIEVSLDPDIDSRPAAGFVFYRKQWLGDEDVDMMSMEAQGCHLRLMLISWEQDPPCSLPDSQPKLKGWCRHPERWEEIWEQVREAWKYYKGRWWQVGSCRAYLKQIDISRKRREAGAEGGRKSRGGANAGRDAGNCFPATQQLLGFSDEAEADSRVESRVESGEERSGWPRAREEHAGNGGRPPEPSPAAAAAGCRAVAYVQGVEQAFAEATGARSPLTVLQREILAGYCIEGVPLEVLAGRIREVAARERTRGKTIGSFRYFARPGGALEDAVTEWREGFDPGPAYEADMLGEYRDYMLYRMSGSVWEVDGARPGDPPEPLVHPDMVRRARERLKLARSVAEVEAIMRQVATSAERRLEAIRRGAEPRAG